MLEKKEYKMIIVISIVFQAIISSQVLVEAKWHSSTHELAQFEAETAMIMALLDLPATDMGKRKADTNPNNQQPKKKKKPAATEYCRSDGGMGSLTESSLKRILNTGLGEKERLFGETHSTQDTYLTIDFGKKVYKQLDKDTHAEDRVLDGERNSALINKNGIWLNNSPCPRCAKMIMRAYSSSGTKPTIYVQSVYIQQGLDSTLDSLMCLAKMLREGFNIVPWDWVIFKNNLGKNLRESCVRYIDEAINNESFKLKRAVVEKALGFLEAVKNCVKEEWCQDNNNDA